MKKFDQGLGAGGLILLAFALAILLTTALPISVSKESVELKDWLGFAGNILGALVTLAAAYMAWRSVQRQVGAQRDAMLLEITTREEDRLESELHANAVLLEMCRQAQLARNRAGPLNYDRALSDIGIDSDEVAMRNAIQRRVSGPIPPTTMNHIASLLAILRTATRNRATVPPAEVPEADIFVRRWENSLDNAIERLVNRNGEGYRLLRSYRTRIERGLQNLQD